MSEQMAIRSGLPPNLTQYEVVAIGGEINVSDGHPRQLPTPGQQKILDAMATSFATARTASFEVTERRAQRAFLDSLGQRAAPVEEGRVLSCYSSSVAMSILSRALAVGRSRIGLIAPTFDNIPDLMNGYGLKLVPLEEAELAVGALGADIDELDAVFITTPNNPTGTVIDVASLERIGESCRDAGCVLILDTSFRGYDRRSQYDCYELLDRVGVSYVVIEDTGKLWPLLELKVGLLAFSSNCELELEHAHADVLLSVSPFVLGLVEDFAEDAAGGGYESLHRLVAENRATLDTALQGTGARLVDADSRIGVARVSLPGDLLARELWIALRDRGVHVLPCGPFHWSRPECGASEVRVALARDREVVELAAEVLRRNLIGKDSNQRRNDDRRG